jgi:hypothetical protein
MHSTPSQEPASAEKNDDLDLLLIIRNIFTFLKKNWIKLLAASFTGLFCGLILHLVFPKTYTSRLLLETNVISNTETRALVDNWNGMLTQRGYPYLMQAFGCNLDLLSNWTRMTAESLNPQNESSTAVSIEVSVLDTSKLQDIQKSLLSGFRNNDYIRRRVEQHRQAAIDQIKQADVELTRLDSTKTYIEGAVESDKKEKSPLILDISTLSSQKVSLVGTKAALEEKLAFVDGMLLIQGFSAPKGPKPGLMLLLAIGFAAGFVLGCFLLLLGDLNRKVSLPTSR